MFSIVTATMHEYLAILYIVGMVNHENQQYFCFLLSAAPDNLNLIGVATLVTPVWYINFTLFVQ